jgi:hypothetical protein
MLKFEDYFELYNYQRRLQRLGKKTFYEVNRATLPKIEATA